MSDVNRHQFLSGYQSMQLSRFFLRLAHLPHCSILRFTFGLREYQPTFGSLDVQFLCVLARLCCLKIFWDDHALALRGLDKKCSQVYWQFLFCCRQLDLYKAHHHGTMRQPGQDWPGQARPGLAWPGVSRPRLAWPGSARRGSDPTYQAISPYG